MKMKNKTLLRLSFAFLCFLIFSIQSCEESSFGEDLQVSKLPVSIEYPEILNSREFSYIESASPFIDANGHSVEFELVSVRKGNETLDDTYLEFVSVVNAEYIEATNPITEGEMYIEDLGSMGTIIIQDGNPFGYGDYYFTIRLTTNDEAGNVITEIYEDAFHLNVAPGLVEGMSYCPFKMNFVSGESTSSDPAELFGGNPDIRYELATESDKLTIDTATGAISLNSSYSISETEILKPIINVISNVTDESTSFENTFTAILSATPVEVEKEANYFFFPTLRTTAKKNVGLGGEGYSRVFVEHLGIKAGDPEETSDWYITNALWKSHKNANKYLPPVKTDDAVAIRDAAGVSNTTKLQMPWWTIENPSDSWIVIDPVNLGLYEGCFNSKAVFWYNLFLNEYSAYELDGSTPIGLEVKITDNYTGDVTTTSWTQVNDVLECEIDNNGTIFTGMPYPGDQTGLDPDGVKDPAKNANNLWVRCELNLEDYKDASAFTIAFRVKTYFDTTPNLPVNGMAQLSNVHFVALEK